MYNEKLMTLSFDLRIFGALRIVEETNGILGILREFGLETFVFYVKAFIEKFNLISPDLDLTFVKSR